MLRAIIGGLTLVVATFGAAPANETIDPNAVDAPDHLREVLAAPKAYAQDRSARCVPVENRQMTIASARGHGLIGCGCGGWNDHNDIWSVRSWSPPSHQSHPQLRSS